MKKFNILYVLIIAVSAVFFTSCNGDEPEPTSDLTWYITEDFNLNRENEKPLTVHVGENITFMSKKADGEVYVVWPGDEGFDYNKRNVALNYLDADSNTVKLNNKGKAMVKNSKDEWVTNPSYIYSKPGTYTVVLVVRNVYDNGLKYSEAVDSAVITVIDTVTKLFDLDESKYKFIPRYKYVNTIDGKTKTGVVAKSDIIVDGTNVTIKLPYEAKIDELDIYIKIDKSTLTGDDADITFSNEDKSYSWKGSLATSKTITVTSQGGDSQDYIISAEVQPAKTGNSMTSFKFGTYVGEISGTTVTVDIPEGLNITKVKPEFEVSQFASVVIGTTPQYSKTTEVDLTGGATYKVTSQFGASVDYSVVIQEIATEFTAFAFGSLNPLKTGVIDDNTKTIDVAVLDGTDVTKIKPTFTVSKFAKVYLGTTEVISGITEIDFTNPVILKVKVTNDIFVDYTVNAVFP